MTDCKLCDETREHVHDLRPILVGVCECGHRRNDHAMHLEGSHFCEFVDCRCEHYRPLDVAEIREQQERLGEG